jgi:Ca2+/Na+ antiporter
MHVLHDSWEPIVVKSVIVVIIIIIIIIVVVVVVIVVVIVIVASDCFVSGVVRLAATNEGMKFWHCATLTALSCYRSNH